MNTNVNEGRGNMSDLERTMERVRKLLAIAQDERANPHEAAAAADQAEKLMRKFQIEHADVISQDLKRRDSFTQKDVSAQMKKGPDHYRPAKVPLWANLLSFAIAKLHDAQVRIVYTDELGACVRFQGYKADVEMCSFTFDYLLNALVQAVRHFQKEDARGKDESASFRSGFVIALCANINRLSAEKKAEMEKASASRALVVVKSNAVIERFGEVKTRTIKTNPSVGDAFSEGRERGRRVDVARRGIGGGETAAARRLAMSEPRRAGKSYAAKQMEAFYESMLKLAEDKTSELYHNGQQHRGAGHRCAFWDGFSGNFDLSGPRRSANVIPGTLSAACFKAGVEFAKRQARRAA